MRRLGFNRTAAAVSAQAKTTFRAGTFDEARATGSRGLAVDAAEGAWRATATDEIKRRLPNVMDGHGPGARTCLKADGREQAHLGGASHVESRGDGPRLVVTTNRTVRGVAVNPIDSGNLRRQGHV